MFWCGGTPDCRGGALWNSDIFKVYMNESSVDFDLTRSDAYAKRAEQVINARAQEIAAKAGKPIAF